MGKAAPLQKQKNIGVSNEVVFILPNACLLQNVFEFIRRFPAGNLLF